MRPFSILLILMVAASCARDTRTPARQPTTPLVLDSLFANTFEDPIPIDTISADTLKQLIIKAFAVHQHNTTYERYAMMLDTFNGSTLQAQIKIGHLFHPGQKSAVLGWSSSDTTTDIEVRTLEPTGIWKIVFTAQNIPDIKSGGTSMKSPFISCIDYNKDGWKDLAVITNAWDGIGVGYQCRVWLVKQDQFTPAKNFELIDSPETDSSTQNIYSYLSGGCADMAMHFSVWRIQADSVFKTEDIDVDCCVGQDGKCLVTKNNQKPIPVAGDKVYLYVPKHFQAGLKEKMSN